jgi:hypothetical protein
MVPLNEVEPTIGCNPYEPDTVVKRGLFLISDGMYTHLTLFTDIPEDVDTFTADVNKLANLDAEAKGNTQKKDERDEFSFTVYKRIRNNYLYIKPICIGSIDKINQSGFPPNNAAAPHTLAPKAVIKEIVKGPDPHTVKVKLMRTKGGTKGKKEARTYIVQVRDTNDTETFKIGAMTTNSTKLIVKDVTFSKVQWYSVVILNTAGSNEGSSSLKFTLYD